MCMCLCVPVWVCLCVSVHVSVCSCVGVHVSVCSCVSVHVRKKVMVVTNLKPAKLAGVLSEGDRKSVV